MSEAKKEVSGKDSSQIPPPSETHDPMIGLVIDHKYKIEAYVGRGGMGVVYQGIHLMMERPIAIKLLHSHLVDSAEFLRRFKHEAKIASRLRHHNAIMLYDYGVQDKVPYLVMEFCPGKTLKEELIETGAMQAKKLNHYVQQICASLSEAHTLGIVHRDIKPENIILPVNHETQKNLRVLDFGIAKLLTKTGDANNTMATQAGMFFGTPGYAAPEQVCNRELDSRSDIYSLGVVFYEALSGVLPFEAPSLMELLLKHVNAKPPPLRSIYPQLGVTQAVDDVIMKCLEKDPANRYQSVHELADAFAEASGKADVGEKLKEGMNLPKGSGFLVAIGLLLALIIWASSDPKDKKEKEEEKESPVVTAAPTATPTARVTATATATAIATATPTQAVIIPTLFPTFTSVPTSLPTVIPTSTATFFWPTPTVTALPTQKAFGDINSITMEGEQYYSERKYLLAIPLFEQALSIDPKLFRIRVDLGTCYLRVGRSADALNQYKLAIAQNPKFAPAYYEMACLYALSSRKSEAIQALSQAVKLDWRLRDAARTEPDLKSLNSDTWFRQVILAKKSVTQTQIQPPRRTEKPRGGESATDVVRRLGRELWSLTQ